MQIPLQIAFRNLARSPAIVSESLIATGVTRSPIGSKSIASSKELKSAVWPGAGASATGFAPPFAYSLATDAALFGALALKIVASSRSLG